MLPTNILVMEGEGATRNIVGDVLGKMGHRVWCAESGERGLDLFSQGLFDVVLSSVNLPGIDGIEAIRSMRSTDPTMVPVVMTSRRDQETAVRALECGVCGFLMKPFSHEDLRTKIEGALKERKRVVETRLLMGDLIQMRSNLEQRVATQERTLSRTERYLNQLLDAAPFAVLSTDTGGQVLTFNGVAEKMYGLTEGEAVGRPLTAVTGKAGPPDNGPVAGGATGGWKAQHVRRSGEGFPVLVRRRAIQDERDRSIAWLYVVEDSSDREQMEAQLLYAERLSLLGQLAPRVAHEFKTPLQLVLGHAELAVQWLADGDIEEARTSIGSIPPAVRKIMVLVRQMSNLGKPADTRPAELDLPAEIEKTLVPLRDLGAVKYCDVVEDYEDSVPRIVGDPAEIEQVFRNLIVNAAQAMEDTPRRVLSLRVYGSDDGEYVVAEVVDTGPGISSEHLEQVFNPFFTTKPEGEGTGLGLAVVKTILDRHGASVSVASAEGEGTHFTLRFRAVQTR